MIDTTHAERCAEIEAQAFYGDLQDKAERKVRDASYAAAQWDEAARIRRGARVAIENTRARVKFQGDKSKAPVGTEGIVFKHDTENGPARLGVRTDDGRTFWTNASNCSPIALNGWDRAQGIDEETEAQAKRAQVVAASAANGLNRNDYVRIEGVKRKQKVFWIGPCKSSGRQRYGAGRNSKGGPWWGYSDEAVKA
jgi:hypothetical protein